MRTLEWVWVVGGFVCKWKGNYGLLRCRFEGKEGKLGKEVTGLSGSSLEGQIRGPHGDLFGVQITRFDLRN